MKTQKDGSMDKHGQKMLVFGNEVTVMEGGDNDNAMDDDEEWMGLGDD